MEKQTEARKLRVPATVFELAVVIPTCGWLAIQVATGKASLEPTLILWTAVVAAGVGMLVSAMAQCPALARNTSSRRSSEMPRAMAMKRSS